LKFTELLSVSSMIAPRLAEVWVSRRLACAGAFSMIVRLADSLGWDVPTWDRLQQRAPAMLDGGYAISAMRNR